MYADICISLATLSGSCRAIAGMGDRRALLHLTQSLMEVLQEDEQQWRNLAVRASAVHAKSDSAIHADWDSAVHAKATQPYTRNRLSHTREMDSAIHAPKHMFWP